MTSPSRGAHAELEAGGGARAARRHRAELKRLEALAREEGRRQTLIETERALVEELALRERRAKLDTAPRSRRR